MERCRPGGVRSHERRSRGHAVFSFDADACGISRLNGACAAEIEERGWGSWVVEIDSEFAGFTGLTVPTFSEPFTPCVEIGWRFRREFWGRGLAYQAACQALRYGFETLKLMEIVSFTSALNARSRRLMERLGLVHDVSSDFDHPLIAEGHELRRHVLYRMRRECWNG